LTPINDDISDDLLARYVAGVAATHEVEQVAAWLAQSSTHQREFERWVQIWEASQNLKTGFDVDTDSAWSTIKNNINDTAIVTLSTHSTHWRWRVAAAVAVLVGIGWWLRSSRAFDTPKTIAETIRSEKKSKNITLPDGSVVLLNHDSELSFGDDFGHNTRSVVLKGQAFFDIKRNENLPFVITARHAEIQVLGTSFDVNARQEAVQVNVQTGRVEVRNQTQKQILTNQQNAWIQTDTITRKIFNINSLSYKSQVFIFEKTTLKEVVNVLREGYQADIRLANTQVANCRLTARFDHESLQNTLAVIAETLQLRVKQEGNVFLFNGEGCK
jgi:transmembrane sensor